MTRYPHFSFPNLYLLNGYREFSGPHGLEREYLREDDLEHCIRKLAIRKSERLKGWDLRFLRRGLELSQSDFGVMVDRDAQTVARWEKSGEAVPRAVDLCIRVLFAARFEPQMSTADILNCVDGTSFKLPETIYLRLTARGWTFEPEPTIKRARSVAHALTEVRFEPMASLRCALFENSTEDHVDLFVREANGSIIVAEAKMQAEDMRKVVQRPQQSLKLTITGSANDDANATIH
jgi:DNA-binding transcriptional regulator YiaG